MKKLLIVVLVLIVAVLLFATTRPDTYHVERSITINAPADKVVALVGNFHEWQRWSPWEDLDPNMKRTITGPPSGLGAVYEWEGNRKVGSGRMDIVQYLPPKRIGIKLHFIRPMEDTSNTDFLLDQQSGATKVTWQMEGRMTYLAKVMCVFTSMDKIIGKDFEKGLSRLKTAAEE